MEAVGAEQWSSLERRTDANQPLLPKYSDEEGLTTLCTEDGSLDIYGRPALRNTSGGWRASTIILGVQCLESLAYYGIATNLVVYLSKALNEDNASIATSITTWTGTCNLTPLLAAIIADSFWGRYRTILVFSLVYFFGMVIITLSASLSILKAPKCEDTYCPSESIAPKLVLFSGLYLIALGSGGMKSSLLPLGADQYEEVNTIEREKKGSFFNWYYFCLNVGALLSSTLMVWFEENVDWGLGFGISTMFITLAVGVFLTGSYIYRLQKPGGSPLQRILQVLVASVKNVSLNVSAESKLYEDQLQNSTAIGCRKISHTDEFRFLDKAALVSDSDTKNVISPSPWRLCTITQVEELKMLLRLVPIWISGVIYSIAYAQLNSTFVEQGSAMDSKLGPFSIPPASLFAFEVLTVMFCILIYDKLIVGIGKTFTKNWHGLTELQRMGLGRFLMIVAMLMAAVVETVRLKYAQDGRVLSIAWQLPQYFIFGVSEIFNCVGQLEFFYGQSPDAMRSICTALSLLTISLGNYTSSFVISMVSLVTSKRGEGGWISSNLNEGHLDYFFYGLAGLSALNFVWYIACASRYKLKEINF